MPPWNVAFSPPLSPPEGRESMPQELRPLLNDVMLATRGQASVPHAPADIGGGIKRYGQDEAAGEPSAPTDRLIFARYGMARLLDERGELRPMGALEEEIIRFAIRHYRGRMSEVARRVGIGRSTLYRKIKEYGIVPGEPVAS
jgi:DNA-binding NtrC family response regulator